MILVMPTVPYSGTHFLKSRILNQDGLFKVINPSEGCSGDKIYSSHYEDRFMAGWLNLVANYPTIIIMRHPYRNKIACERRPTTRNHVFDWYQNWTGLIDVSYHFVDVMYLHVDDMDIREDEAAAIRKRFRPDLGRHIDWTLNGKDTNTKSGTHSIDIEHDSEIPEIFIDFYEMTKQ